MLGKSKIWFILEHGFIKRNLTVNLQEIIEIFQRFKMLIQVQIKLPAGINYENTSKNILDLKPRSYQDSSTYPPSQFRPLPTDRT